MSSNRIDARSAVFEPDGDHLVPTGFARGPWYPNGQHGSAMLGLLARAIERHPSPHPVQTTRLTVDLMRAAPMEPVQTPVQVLRAGRNTEVIQAEIISGGEVHARATAMRFRTEEIDTSEETPRYGNPSGFVLPTGNSPSPWADDEPSDLEAFHLALDMRPPLGSELPAIWFRILCPLVAGEETSPLVRTAIFADWTYSLPHMTRFFADAGQRERDQSFSAINPDTSINLFRPMEGEWLCLEGQTHYGQIGAGVAMAHLYDERGAVGHSSQSVLIRGAEKRPPPIDELAEQPRTESE
jgi:acyl-coenzyme A thioesterase PaaI-like protein